jgi:hypothetical protein
LQSPPLLFLDLNNPGILDDNLWAMDEVHFQQHGSRCRMWVPPEVADPVCLHAPTRKSISIFGAVRLNDGKLVMSRPNGMFDAATCWDFYRKLEHCRRPGRKMVVIIEVTIQVKGWMLEKQA